MKTTLFWIPRIAAVLFIGFLALFSLDIFVPGASWQEMLIGFLIHNIPVFILIIALIVAWKYDLVGGIVFILGGLAYILQISLNASRYGFAWYMLSYIFIIALPPIIIGILFLLHRRMNQHHR